MATLVLTAAVAGLGLTGFGLFAATLAATALGTFIDNRLFGANNKTQQQGPRLTEMQVSVSTEGQPIKRLYGRARMGGNLIWTTNFKETSTQETQDVGGKGSSSASVTTTNYQYSVSCAFAFTEGNSKCRLGRIWVDNKLLDTNGLTYRFYPGSQDQIKDPLIVSIEGDKDTSAYRGVCYLVFEDLALENFGNRIPQITAEIIVSLNNPETEIFENLLEGMNLVPGTGEVAYSTVPSVKSDGFGNSVSENAHLKSDETDIEVSVTDLVTQAQNVKKVNLVVTWFGTDLRMGECDIEPRVADKLDVVVPVDWKVSGLTRLTANQISEVTLDGNTWSAFQSTPSDDSIVEAIQYLCDEKELKVGFYPQILMDIPVGNGLTDPYGGDEQAAYPWRGLICPEDPSGPVTRYSGDSNPQISSFFGTAEASDFTVSGTTVTYTGSSEDKGLRRMIFHYAHLFAASANTLEDKTLFSTFYIGSQLRGVTWTRFPETYGGYPCVWQLRELLNDVKAFFVAADLSHVEVSYAADFTEYHSHQPSYYPGHVYYHLDYLWHSTSCAFVGIDNFFPISDWRDGTDHLDYGTGNDSYGNPKATSIYSKSYLQGQIEGGEFFDYYYASENDRTNQLRTSLLEDVWAPLVGTPGLASRPEIYKQKDVRTWWSTYHWNRVLGYDWFEYQPATEPLSDWFPREKRIVFTQFGCPAVDKGTNQPNIVYNPLLGHTDQPYFSLGIRDDTIQRAYYEAVITYWRDNSPVDADEIPMISVEDMNAYAWDIRPFPAFPFRTDIWPEGKYWSTSHLLNDRLGIVTLSELVSHICGWVGFTSNEVDTSGLISASSTVRGYPIDNLMSPREALTPLFSAYLFDGFESQGKIKFLMRSNTPFSSVNVEDLIISTDNPSGYQLNRAQETELPAKSILSFYDEQNDYQVGSFGTQRQTTTSVSTIELKFPLVLPQSVVNTLASLVIQESWAAREVLEITFPINHIALDPGDGITITLGGRELDFRITSIQKNSVLELNAETIDTTIYDALIPGESTMNTNYGVTVIGRTLLQIMNIPMVNADDLRPWAPRLAVYQRPFPKSADIYENTGTDLILLNQMTVLTQFGVLVAPLSSGPRHVIDEGNVIEIDINSPTYQVLSDTELNVRNGSNAIAIRTSNGDWEIMKFVNSSLQSGRRYHLSRLLRGQLGTWSIMEDEIPIGSPVVFLNSNSITALNIPESRKYQTINYRYGPNSYATGSGFYQNTSHVGQAVGQMPYPVADIQFFPKESSVKITWKRQTRFGGEGFEEPEVPLNEDYEKYEIDLLDETDMLLSTVSVTSPLYVFSGAPSIFTIKIYQMSASVGRGRPATALYEA